MIEKRKTEEFSDGLDNWKIYFDLETDGRRGDSTVLISLILNKKENHYLREKDLENLRQDLEDLGKLRLIKKGRGLLGE